MHIRTEQDYYALLGVPAYATSDELRTAYRVLAKKLHPDVALDEASRQKDFSLINEAYEVLSHPERRAQYDEHRWQMGIPGPGRKPVIPSCEEFLHQAEQLRLHMQQIDQLRMNHEALHDFVLDLLREEHLQCLASHPEHRRRVFECVFESIQSLALQLRPGLAPAMKALAGADVSLQKQWDAWMKASVQERRWNRYRPLIVMLCSVLICFALWLFARR
ncbi:MAG: J domain-containing protein [Bacteroidetes bacterium]|nr:J domain-containing protein [Bacteroidota bacterium]MBS1630107.1 J domain-containing protein [Bacteroidota bacterium]